MTNAESLKAHLKAIGVGGMTIRFVLGDGLAEHLDDPQQIQALVQATLKPRFGVLMLLDAELLFFSGHEGFRKNPFELRVRYSHISEVHHRAGMLYGSMTIMASDEAHQFTDVIDTDKGLDFAERLRSATARAKRVAEVYSVWQSPAVVSTGADSGELTRRGIDASKASDTASARQFFEEALRLDPQNELAWLWMSGVVSSDAERRQCLEKVLAINPQNALALRGLEKLRPAGEPKAEGRQIPQPLPVRGEAAPTSGSFCPSCGQRTEPESRFCRHCGANLLGTVIGVPLRPAAEEERAKAPPPQAEEVLSRRRAFTSSERGRRTGSPIRSLSSRAGA